MDFKVNRYTKPIFDDWGYADYWHGRDWVNWHKTLVFAYGKKHADWLVLNTWNKQNTSLWSGSMWDNYAPMNDYFKAQGLKIERGSPMTFIVRAADAVSSALSMGKDLFYIGVVGYGGYLAYQATRPKPKPAAVKGISSNGFLLGALAIGGAAVLMGSTGSTEKGYYTTTPAGVPLEGTRQFYEDNKGLIDLALDSVFQSVYMANLADIYLGDPKRKALVATRMKRYGKTAKQAVKAELAEIFAYWDTNPISSKYQPAPWYDIFSPNWYNALKAW